MPTSPAPAALAVADQNHPKPPVEVVLGHGERLVDAQPGAPEQHDQRPQAGAMGAVAGPAHDSDDLLHCGRIARVAQPLVGRSPPGEIAGQGDGRAPAAGGVQQPRHGHRSFLSWDDRVAYQLHEPGTRNRPPRHDQRSPSFHNRSTAGWSGWRLLVGGSDDRPGARIESASRRDESEATGVALGPPRGRSLDPGWCPRTTGFCRARAVSRSGIRAHVAAELLLRVGCGGLAARQCRRMAGVRLWISLSGESPSNRDSD